MHRIMKFGFVVLHYKTINDTIECVESILKIDGNYQIFIIDNYSNDGTYEELCNIYSKQDKIILYSNKSNLGFAKGNNEGIKIAQEYNCDFVVLLNNDTAIYQRDFIEKCIKNWEKSKFSIAGPRIISMVDNKDQNPFIIPNHFIKTRRSAFKLYMLGLVKYIMVLIGIPEWWENSNTNESITNGKESNYINSDTGDFLLCGAALILSPTYFEKYSKLCELTFLYEEETIIYILSRILNYRMEYNPNIVLYHKEQSSTKFIFGKGREKKIFGYKEDFRSRKQVLKIMLHMKNNGYISNLIK